MTLHMISGTKVMTRSKHANAPINVNPVGGGGGGVRARGSDLTDCKIF